LTLLVKNSCRQGHGTDFSHLPSSNSTSFHVEIPKIENQENQDTYQKQGSPDQSQA